MYDEAALARLIARLRQELLTLQRELAYFAKEARVSHRDPNFDPHEQEVAEHIALYSIENAIYLVEALLLSRPALADLYKHFKESLPAKLLEHEWGRYDWDEQYVDFPAQNAVERFFDLGVAAIGGTISSERIEILDNICAGIGEAIRDFADRGWMPVPGKETPIKHLGFRLLKSAFPDAEPDGEISFKLPDGRVRKPDAAIPSLRVCVEFKYANDAAELNQRVDEIVADMSAYGDPRYDKFRAVVFAAYDGISNEELQKLLKHRLENIRLTYEWRAFLVRSVGRRTRRTT